MDTLTLDDLAEHWGPEQIPTTESAPTSLTQSTWARDGVVIRPKLLDDELLAAYEAEWSASAPGPHGWGYATPYMDHPALRRLVCDQRIADILVELIGEEAGVHLNLTGWRSTTRDWHFDQYLNEPYVGGFYVAVWVALDDIHPDAGPFQYVPGSHHWWHPISQAKMRAALGPDGDGPDWPTHSERILTPLFEAEIAERQITPTTHLPQRGDVLFWHSRLLHRGSVPVDPNRERRALIAHYSGIGHRPDMPQPRHHPAGGWMFPLGGRQPVRSDT